MVVVVAYSGVGDVETVIVDDGVVRKRGGKLVAVELEGGEKVEWAGVAERVGGVGGRCRGGLRGWILRRRGSWWWGCEMLMGLR